MKKKKKLGQFFTTNSDYILQNFENVVKNKSVCDPFAGNGDLLKWASKNSAQNISGFDIDKNLLNENIKLNDSLISIPKADFIITNPPYLGKNKMTKSQKSSYDLNEYEDFYLLSIRRVIEADPNEGILIIPINFFSAENSDSLRKEFLSKYTVESVNYFTEQVFDDTTCNVVSFYFYKKYSNIQDIKFKFYPSKKEINFQLREKHSYKIGGEDIEKILTIPIKGISRLTEKNIISNAGNETLDSFYNDLNHSKKYKISAQYKTIIENNIILLNCIDTNSSKDGWIKAEDIKTYNKDCLVGKNTSRNIAYILIENSSTQEQKQIISLFNNELNNLREKYNSLFLTNFRDNDRKRASFEFCYKLILYCKNKMKENKNDK